MSATEAAAAAFFAQSVARLLAPPGAEEEAVRCLRAEDLPDLLAHLRERLAQARAEGEAAGRAAERADVVAWLMRTEWADEEAYHIEAGRHVGAAGGAA